MSHSRHHLRLVRHNLVPVLTLDMSPLFLVRRLIDSVGRELGNLVVLELLGEDEVEDDGQEGRDGEPILHDQHNGVEEAEEGVVGARVGEDVAEPTVPTRVVSNMFSLQKQLGAGERKTYVGTRVAPKPGASAAVRMNLLRRLKCTLLMMRIPDVATEANRNVVMPPSTDEGMETRAAANLLKMPMMRSQKQQA